MKQRFQFAILPEVSNLTATLTRSYYLNETQETRTKKTKQNKYDHLNLQAQIGAASVPFRSV